MLITGMDTRLESIVGLLLFTPDPGETPVFVIWIVLHNLAWERAQSASIVTNASGVVILQTPLIISALSIPVCERTPVFIAEIFLCFNNFLLFEPFYNGSPYEDRTRVTGMRC